MSPTSTFPFLLLSLFIKTSLQSCSSTVAVTTCTWDTLKSSHQPLQVNDYKTFLSIPKGNLEAIPNGVFRLMPQITVLQMTGNKIKKLEANSLQGLANLKQLNLYDNRLTALDQNVLSHCTGLEKLDLGMNKLTVIHEKAFEFIGGLKHLNLAFNSLKMVPVALGVLTQLQTLRLDNNAIEMVKSNAFSSHAKLEDLALNDNKLTKVEANAFAGLKKLKKLDLRSNFLTDLNVADLLRDTSRSLSSVALSLNDFRCDSLRRILEEFRRSSVEVSRGYSKSANNVHGISCKA